VINTGERPGDEVVQIYLSINDADVSTPLRSLAGFQRIHLTPGERRTVSFQITPRQMSVIDDGGLRVVRPGTCTVAAGGKQPGFTGSANALTTNVITDTFSIEGEQVELEP
jgi:beta-glucosidase